METVDPGDGGAEPPPLPSAVVGVYPLEFPVLLHSGPLSVLQAGSNEPLSVTGTGTVSMECTPRPRVVWDVLVTDAESCDAFFTVDTDEELVPPTPESGDLAIPPTSSAAPNLSVPPDVWPPRFDGELPPTVVGGTEELCEVRFHVINWNVVLGQVAVARGRSGFQRGRCVLEAEEWIVVLDAVPEVEEKKREAARSAGYVVTHIGSLARRDGTTFSFAEADDVMDALFGFLAFVRAGAVGIALPVGIDLKGQACCAEWSCTRADPAGYRQSWYPEFRPEALADLWPAFLALSSDPYWQRVLRRVVMMQCATNEAPVERGLMTACATLELLCWSVLVETERWLTANGYDKLTFADCLRLALNWACVDVAVPAVRTDLVAHAGRFNLRDGPEALAWVRNRVVHPDRKQQIVVESMTDAWFVSLWYVDLLILRLLGYQGEYGSRIRFGRHVGELDQVPWG